MTDKQKIRNYACELLKDSQNGFGSASYNMLKMVIAYIDSLPEEPVSEVLEEAADNALSNVLNTHEIVNVRSCLEMFRLGAKWQKERINETLLSEVLPYFMHGGEADEVVAKLDEVLNQKK